MNASPISKDELTDNAMKALRAILLRKFLTQEPLASQHEGFALLQERVDTLWETIKRRERAEALADAFEVAATAMLIVIEAPLVHPKGEDEEQRPSWERVDLAEL